MGIPVARVHLKVAHAALPAPPPCVAATVLPKPSLAVPSRADTHERWDAHKACPASSASSSSSALSTRSVVVRSSVKNATSLLPVPKPGRADSVKRWDAHKKAASPSASSSSSSSVTSSIVSSSKWSMSRASSAERWDVHKKRCPPQADLLNDGESSSTGSNDGIDTEEEIVWKPRAMYAGPGFVGAAPEPSKLPMPTAFLVPVA